MRVEQKLVASLSRLQTLISEVEQRIQFTAKNGLATTTYVEAPNRNQVDLSEGWQIPLPQNDLQESNFTPQLQTLDSLPLQLDSLQVTSAEDEVEVEVGESLINDGIDTSKFAQD